MFVLFFGCSKKKKQARNEKVTESGRQRNELIVQDSKERLSSLDRHVRDAGRLLDEDDDSWPTE